MDILKKWYNSSSPLVKVLMAVSMASGLVVIHRCYYGPYIRRQRHLRAEEWASIIIEKEESMKESTENH